MICQEKHCKFQVPEEHFNCPKCGAAVGDFCIDDGPGLVEDCDLLHPHDYLVCYNCGYSTTGKAFSTLIKKKLSMIECPHCKGTGHIRKGGV